MGWNAEYDIGKFQQQATKQKHIIAIIFSNYIFRQIARRQNFLIHLSDMGLPNSTDISTLLKKIVSLFYKKNKYRIFLKYCAKQLVMKTKRTFAQ